MPIYLQCIAIAVLVWLVGITVLHLLSKRAPQPYPEIDLDKKREEIATRDARPTEPLPPRVDGTSEEFKVDSWRWY